MTIERRPFGFDSAERLSAAPGSGRPSAALGNPPPSPEAGKAPRLQARSLGGDGPRSWALVFRGGDEVMSGLTDFAKREGIEGGHLSGIGALSSATLAFFDRTTLDYLSIPVADQTECLSMTGDVGFVDGEPLLHVHCVLGFPDGTVKGGHLVEAVVWPTMEIFLTESPTALPKAKDPESGLELYSFD